MRSQAEAGAGRPVFEHLTYQPALDGLRAMWDLDAFGALFGQPSPGSGEAVTNDPVRYQTLNRIDDDVARAFPSITRVDYAEAIAGPDGAIGDDERMDGLHLEAAFADEISRTVLFELFEQAYRDATTDPSAEFAIDGDTTWDAPG